MDALLKRLGEASNEGDIDKLKQLLQEDPLLFDKVLTEVRDNPLHIAALRGHVDFAAEVLGLKPEFATKLNREGRSPLHLAAARGHLQVAEILVDKVGSDICQIRESNNGYLPVHLATVNGNCDVVKMLIERCNETLEKTTRKLETLIHLAVMANCLDCVSYLIDQNVNLNEKDENGNTCLHLAVAKHNRQVITCLLNEEGIEINSKNSMGMTPLDVLLVFLLHSAVDISLVNTIRRAGGVEAAELQDLESNRSNSVVVGGPPRSNQRLSRGNKKMGREKQSDAKTLLIVATLVATMTFQAILNPPGGFIPFEMGNTFNATTLFRNWRLHTFPAGRPVLLWKLDAFFLLDSVALFSSVSVILWLLCAVPKTKIMMKLLVTVVWLSAYCTALAYGSAFATIYIPDRYSSFFDFGFDEYAGRFRWVSGLFMAFFLVYVITGLWATVIVIRYLWRKAGFKKQQPNRIEEVRCWPIGSKWFNRIIFIVLMVCVVGAFVLLTSVIMSLCSYAHFKPMIGG